MKRTSFLFFLLLIPFFSFAHNANNKRTFKFKEVKKLSFEVYDTISPRGQSYCLWQTFYDMNQEKVYTGDYISDKKAFLYIECDFKKAELKSVKISYPDAPMGVDGVVFCKWLPSGNLCVRSNYSNQIQIYSLDGKLQKEISLSFLEKNKEAYSCSPYGKLLVCNQKLSLQTIPNASVDNRADRAEVNSKTFGVSIDLKKGKRHKSLKIHYPSNYQEGNFYYNNNYALAMNRNNQLICSFRCNDSIFVYDNNKEFVKAFYAGSDSKPEFIPFDEDKQSSTAEISRYNKVEPYYDNLLFDPIRNLCYRFFYDRLSYDLNVIKCPGFSQKRQSVIIIDRDFNRMGEVEFKDGDVHPTTQSVPTEEGLMNVCDHGLIYGKPSVRKFTLNWLKLVEVGHHG
ncbi:MAG: DUF4221 family protein [Bacteroidales bacterium]